MRMRRNFAQHQHARRATWNSYMANNRVTASAESDKLCPHNCCKMLFLHKGCLCSECMDVACGPVCASHFRRSCRTFEIEPVLSVGSMRSPEPPTRHIHGRSHKQGNALLDSTPKTPEATKCEGSATALRRMARFLFPPLPATPTATNRGGKPAILQLRARREGAWLRGASGMEPTTSKILILMIN